MEDVFIVAAGRTPFGRLQGRLSAIRVDDLLAHLVADIARQAGVLDYKNAFFFAGAANQAGEDNRNLARQAALLSGLSPTTHATTFNALCNAGIEAFLAAVRALQTGAADLAWAVAGENMSRSPFVRHRYTGEEADSLIGWRFENPLLSPAHRLSMVEIAEQQAAQFGFSRLVQDNYAALSRQKYEAALKADFFAAEIRAVPTGEGQFLSYDEQHRCFTAEALARLPPLLGKDKNKEKTAEYITLGNSARAGDGAVALLLATSQAVKDLDLQPLARFVAAEQISLAPSEMNAAATTAALRLIQRHSHKKGVALANFDFVELSESFALQPLHFMQNFTNINPDIINICGGSLSAGNPTAAGNLRLLTATISQFQRSPQKRQALMATCSGLGLGAAIALQSEL